MADSTDTVSSLQEDDWTTLLDRIKDKKCTPIIGPGIRAGGLALRSLIAQDWAKEFEYPLDDSSDLARVSRFVSVRYDADFIGKRIIADLNKSPTPDFNDANEPYVVLAKLALPIYLTTNYDTYMEQALAWPGCDKDPKTELSRWKESLKDRSSYLTDGFEPKVANPLVYHLYGYPESSDTYPNNHESLVLTEDDYLEFLINVASGTHPLHSRIERAIMGTSLLLLGYRLDDWDFRILFHLLLAKLNIGRSTGRTHVAVQIAPVREEATSELKKKVQDYLDRYIVRKSVGIKVFWGTTQAFIRELKRRREGI
jgi:hypothetical protein